MYVEFAVEGCTPLRLSYLILFRIRGITGRAWIQELSRCGLCTGVCRGADEGTPVICRALGRPSAAR